MSTADLNNVNLIGRLVRDAMISYVSNGTAVSKFSIAVNRSVKKGDSWENEVSFIDCVLWGRQAETLNKYLLKGKQIGITGEVRQNRWEQDGQNRSRIEIVANRVQLLGGGNSSGNSEQSNGYNSGGYQSGSSQGAASGSPARQESFTPLTPSDGFADDIPF